MVEKTEDLIWVMILDEFTGMHIVKLLMKGDTVPRVKRSNAHILIKD